MSEALLALGVFRVEAVGDMYANGSIAESAAGVVGRRATVDEQQMRLRQTSLKTE